MNHVHTRATAATAVALATVIAAIAPATAARSEAPFESIAGRWHGQGRIKLEHSTESMSCLAYYNAKDGGTMLGMSIQCASTSYKIELRSNLQSRGGRVSGTWEERNFNAGGDVSGSVAESGMNLRISGTVAGSMSVSFGPHHQTVNISTEGAGFSGVTISLARN